MSSVNGRLSRLEHRAGHTGAHDYAHYARLFHDRMRALVARMLTDPPDPERLGQLSVAQQAAWLLAQGDVAGAYQLVRDYVTT